MKRILVPIAMLRSEEERVVRILRSMGPERIEFRRFSPENEAEVSPTLEPIARRGLIVDVPDEMSLPWVERMVEHALRDADMHAVLDGRFAAVSRFELPWLALPSPRIAVVTQ